MGCRNLIDHTHERFICSDCFNSIALKDDYHCAFCGAPVTDGTTCPFCRKDHALDQLFVATSYHDRLIETMVKMIKYKFVHSLTHDAAQLMIAYSTKHNISRYMDRRHSMVVPVPLHRLRYNWRGFNQAAMLAHDVSNALELPCTVDILQRRYRFRAQAEIHDRSSRIKNMHNVFLCTKPDLVRDKTIILIDDVSTTGSTLENCARILKTAGAQKVIGFVLARGI